MATEISEAGGFELHKDYYAVKPLDSEDVANAVLYVLRTHPHVQVGYSYID